jgi:glycosyltransferase involved in cell wall biosynthesis
MSARSRLRIAFDARVVQDRYHGIGRHTLELLRVIRDIAPPDLEFVLLAGHAPDERLSVRRDLALREGMTIEPFDAPIASVRQQWEWRRLVARLEPDVAFAPYHLGAPLAIRPPTVIEIHDCIFEEDGSFAPGLRGRAYPLVTKLILARAASVVTVSDATRAAVEQYYRVRIPRDHVVRNGVDARFEARAEAAPDDLARLGISDRFILHVGVRRPHKDQATLVLAFAAIAHDDPTVALVLVGPQDERFPDPLPDLIARHGLTGRVIELPRVDEGTLRTLLQSATVFAFPSLVEGFGMPVLEAMMAGTAVVASDIPAVREAAGDAAYLVPPRDVAAWATALRRLMRHDRERLQLVARGRARALSASWHDGATVLLRVLERAASPTRQTAQIHDIRMLRR